MNAIAAPSTTYNIAFGSTIKMLADDNHIGGYLITFTDENNRDLDNEYFSKATDLATPHQIEVLPLLFHHGLDPRLKDVPMGHIVKAALDDHGLWVESILNEREQYERFVAQWYADKDAPISVENYEKAIGFIKTLIKAGKLGYSSGANPNTAVIGDSGHIDKWSIFEASATHTPADPGNAKLHTLKSIIDLFPSTVEAIGASESKESGESDGNTSRDLRGDDTQSTNTPSDKDSLMEDEKQLETVKTSNKMTDEEFEKLVKRVLDAIDKRKAEDMDDEDMEEIEKSLTTTAKAKLADQETVSTEDAVKALLEALPGAIETALTNKAALDAQINSTVGKTLENTWGKSQVGSGSHKTPDNPNITVYSRYNDWTAEDFSFAIDIYEKAIRHPNIDMPPAVRIDDKFMKEYADKSLKAYEKREIDLTQSAVKSFRSMKANEVVYSTQAGGGDEHVPTMWRMQIWRRARRDNVILPLFQTVEMPSNPYELPVEGTDQTVYLVPETTAQSELSLTASPIPDSKVGTSKVTLSAKKLGLLTFISSEMQEDGVPGAIPMYREQATRSIMDAIDNVLANGDDATSGNINLDGGTPAATAKYMAFDALLQNAIVANSTNALSASGASPTLQTIRQVRFLLDRSKQSVSNLAIVTHPEVEAKLLNMDEFVTMDKAGSRATNMTGQIGVIDGIPVFVSNEIALADSDGKITDGGNVVERGRLMIVHRPSWYVGYRRNVTTTLEFQAGWDAWHLTSTVRIAFIGQDGDSVSVLYNIAV